MVLLALRIFPFSATAMAAGTDALLSAAGRRKDFVEHDGGLRSTQALRVKP